MVYNVRTLRLLALLRCPYLLVSQKPTTSEHQTPVPVPHWLGTAFLHIHSPEPVDMTEKLKLIVAGCRDFTDYSSAEIHLDLFFTEFPECSTIISGGASGADSIGERYAKERGHPLEVYRAQWSKHGRSAGPIRNKLMSERGTHLLAFWDGKSRGTANMIMNARNQGLWIRVISVNEGYNEKH
jgi:hypothetical protein